MGTEFKALIDSAVAPFVAGFAVMAKLADPSADTAALTSTVEGDVKHVLRGKIGFAVDFLWASGEFKGELDRVIAEELSGPSVKTALETPLLIANGG